MRIAMLSPIAWRTPPRHYGPWESVVSLLTEGLIAKGIDVTLFATADSITKGQLHAVCKGGYEENSQIEPKVWECLHISELFEKANEYDLIHNHFDFLPLTYSKLVTTPVVTTIHGFSSPRILPVYEKYNEKAFYVAISEADRSPNLNYIATIHHGIDLDDFTFVPEPEDSLLFFGRIHPEKGAKEAIEIARAAGKKLIMAGVIQDEAYFEFEVEPHIDGDNVTYVGSVGPEQRDELLGKASPFRKEILAKINEILSEVERNYPTAISKYTPADEEKIIMSMVASLNSGIEYFNAGIAVPDECRRVEHRLRALSTEWPP